MPKEYIEREVLTMRINKALRLFGEHKDLIRLYSDIRGCIACEPTADVVQVVRCKDCKHRGNDDICPMIKIRMCNDGDGYFDEVSEDETFDDGFCSYGERKEEN